MDPELWKPYLEHVCVRHFSTKVNSLRPGLAGSFPTFIVNDRWVLKFFGPLFDGALSFEAERVVNLLVATDPFIPAAKLITEGHLFDEDRGWSWPYLVFSYLPGWSLGEVSQSLPFQQKKIIAHQLGLIISHLHALPLPSHNLFPNGCDSYETFLQQLRAGCVQTHRIQGHLPSHLVEQIDGFLQLQDQIKNDIKPVLIHADLTGDHLLGKLEGGRWITSGLIDFGDAMPGELAYELVALHLDLFRCNKELLSIFLDSYGIPPDKRQKLYNRAMAAALMHRFPVFAPFKKSVPALTEIATLKEFTYCLWNPDYPGFRFRED